MFNKKHKFVSSVIIILVLAQMVFMPFAPVLAEELLEVPAQETVVVPPVVDVLVPPVADSATEETAVIPEVKPVAPTEEVSSTTILVAPVVEPVVATSTDTKNDVKQEEQKAVDKKIFSYAEMMRKTSNYRLGLSKNVDKTELADELKSFIKSEEQNLKKLGVNADKEDKYFSLLRQQLVELGGDDSNLAQKMLEKVQEVMGMGKKENVTTPVNLEDQVKIPAHPATFGFSSEPVTVKAMKGIYPRYIPEKDKLNKKLMGILLGEVVRATPDDLLPVVGDVKADGAEVIISSEIEQLAVDLQHNPVKIFNYLKNNISYEPYAGAKKGSVGCYKEKVCNDIDTTSLAVALLRASGVPARYKKGVAVISVTQLKNLLGVDETKTVYAALASNKVSVHLLSGSVITEGLLDQADLTGETHLALEWTYPEIYYEYDQRGANLENTLDFSSADTTPAVQDLLFYAPSFYQKQWLPFEVLIKPYTRATKEIVADSANFNGETFWNGFFSYQGDLFPVAKYQTDLKTATGKDPFNANYQSGKTVTQKDFQILPAVLPYTFGAGEDSQGNVYSIESWSVLPNERRPQVKITLKKSSDNQIVLEHTFFASEVNNAPLELSYEGATDDDKALIESYGGIHATPSALVDIKPYILGPSARYEATQSVNIGDSLIMQFDYTYSNLFAHTDEKFSTAGNNEGIYISLSKLAPDNYLDDINNPNRNSLILLNGNASIAREYLKRNEDNGKLIKQSLDYQFNTVFSRAVVTQNRVLSVVNGSPTTFDFGGLTVDAGTYITDWSNRGNYKNHRREFRLLWGLQASYDEGQMFKDVAGLDGISTVKGLQYTKGLPAEYTVHTINTANENVIDTLSLSANTKANMHTEVQAGNKIITPDKTVTKGAFRGILYVVLKPDWTGTYAIGEQVANGGWTTNQYTITRWNGDNASVHLAYEVDSGPNKFIYKDDALRNVLCSIKVITYNQIVGGDIAPGWRMTNHGKPCMGMENYLFGQHDNSFVLSTNGAYFASQSEGYSYWTTSNLIETKFVQKYPGSFTSAKRIYPYWGTLVNQDTNLKRLIVYNPANREPYTVAKKFYDNYLSDAIFNGKYLNNKIVSDYLPGIVGYPKMDSATAAEYRDSGTDGLYQQFTNGTLYFVDNMWPIANDTYVVPGLLEQEHNNRGGTSVVGFPTVNPAVSAQCPTCLVQTFENGQKIRVDLSVGAINVADETYTLSINRDYEAQEYEHLVEGIMDGFAEIDVYGVSVNFAAGIATSKIIKQFTKKMGTKAVVKIGVKFIPYVGWAYAGISGSLAALENRPLYNACNADPELLIEGKRPSYYCGKLAVNGVAYAAGISFDVVAGKLNKLGVFTTKARLGKNKLFNNIEDSGKWQEIKRDLYGDYTERVKSGRSQFLERLNELPDNDSKMLSKNSKVVDRFVHSPVNTVTWNGFVSNGVMAGNVKYRVDPFFSNEFDAYTRSNSFTQPRMFRDGITKQGFYRTDELNTLLHQYEERNYGGLMPDGKKQRGEIMFVMKTDGTIILSPRQEYTGDILPHPVLSGGEDVIAAGIIEPDAFGSGRLILRNSTGHFKVHLDDLDPVKLQLESLGYTVQKKDWLVN